MEANPLFGRPWKISGRFNSFEEADKKRKQLSSEKNLQVKVKKLAEFFVVKTRSTIVEKPKKEESYADVITAEAQTDEGIIDFHKVKDKYYFEIPSDLLEREVLIVSRIAGHVKGINFGGAGMKSRPQQVIRFQKKDDKK